MCSSSTDEGELSFLQAPQVTHSEAVEMVAQDADASAELRMHLHELLADEETDRTLVETFREASDAVSAADSEPPSVSAASIDATTAGKVIARCMAQTMCRVAIRASNEYAQCREGGSVSDCTQRTIMSSCSTNRVCSLKTR